MSYIRPVHESRSLSDTPSERPRSAWESPFQSVGYRPYQPLPSSRSNQSTPAKQSDLMDAESSDSDVSTTNADEYRFTSPITTPAALPPPPPKHTLESSEAVQAHLRELQRVEDHNIRKQDLLRAKRKRMDDRLRRQRELQDQKIKVILDARNRRDERIAARRGREDSAFERFDQELEEEENNLRRRLKRLKRGLPLDEGPHAGRATSSASMSPPAPAFATLPPAKRHQTGPPGQHESAAPYRPSHLSPQNSISITGPPPPLPSHPLQPVQATPAMNDAAVPQYSFYPGNAPSHSSPYNPNPPYGSSVPSTSSPVTNGPSRTIPPLPDRPSYTSNGNLSPTAPKSLHHTLAPITSNMPVQNSNRQPTSTYDTRPPPPPSNMLPSSGFAPINAPPTSGFAAINARATGTPPAAQMDVLRSHDNGRMASVDQIPPDQHMYNPNSANTAIAPPHLATTGRRAPSTTHPYQMSEAFANRHHHCERVDRFNRGIWTSYGPAGTQENPTGPPVEMYLRCNHDGCQRIDWRTVHGLQCHIVKSHEQPKGTIGSLEKALDRYGVPVREVEDYERQHGDGTGGTSADPKNLKIKTKTREASLHRTSSPKSLPGSYGVDPNARPAGYKPDVSSPHGVNIKPASPHSMLRTMKSHESSTQSEAGSPASQLKMPIPRPAAGGFVALNGTKSPPEDARGVTSQGNGRQFSSANDEQKPLVRQNSGAIRTTGYSTLPPSKNGTTVDFDGTNHNNPRRDDGPLPEIVAITGNSILKSEPQLSPVNTKFPGSVQSGRIAKGGGSHVSDMPNGTNESHNDRKDASIAHARSSSELEKGESKDGIKGEVMIDPATTSELSNRTDEPLDVKRVERAIEKPTETSTDRPIVKSDEKVPVKPAEKPTETVAETLEDKVVRPSIEKVEKMANEGELEIDRESSLPSTSNTNSVMASPRIPNKTLPAPSSVKRSSRRSSTARKLSVSAGNPMDVDSKVNNSNPPPGLLPAAKIEETSPTMPKIVEKGSKVNGEDTKDIIMKDVSPIIKKSAPDSGKSGIEKIEEHHKIEDVDDGDSITVVRNELKDEPNPNARPRDRDAAKTPPRRMTNSRSLRRGRT